jgi:hypothetical protein
MQTMLEPFVRELGEVREELGRERAEERIEELERQLEARESPEPADEQQGRGQLRPATGGAQEPLEPFGDRGSGTARGSLWRRIFGRF